MYNIIFAFSEFFVKILSCQLIFVWIYSIWLIHSKIHNVSFKMPRLRVQSCTYLMPRQLIPSELPSCPPRWTTSMLTSRSLASAYMETRHVSHWTNRIHPDAPMTNNWSVSLLWTVNFCFLWVYYFILTIIFTQRSTNNEANWKVRRRYLFSIMALATAEVLPTLICMF